jgi:SAM-dependent methyltransferase
MWNSPVYKLNRPLGFDKHKNRRYEQIVIDVTKSAPPFSVPGSTLEKALRATIAAAGIHRDQAILDFGAGKLRNALFLLKGGYRVCGVEYKQLFEESDQAKSLLQSAKRHGSRFSRLVYPHQFNQSNQKFDLALLINVINIMPVAAERLLVLQYCHQKLRPNGHLLWYTQRGDADYRDRLIPRYAIGDGHYVGRGNKYKTFYREFTVAEIDALLAGAGFELVRSIAATARNQARLYRRLEIAPFSSILSASKITSAQVVDESIPRPTKGKPNRVVSHTEKKKGNPDPAELRLPSLCIARLEKISCGAQSATKYQQHVKQMLEILFEPQELRNFKLEVVVFGQTKRLDVLAANKSREGFFYSLKEDHNLTCPTIVIECKNYRHNVANPEFDQLGSRLGKKLGMVGILAYRTSNNRKSVIKKCQSFFDNEGKVILPLRDEDFVALLNFKSESKDQEIEDFLDKILLEVKAG